MNSDKMPFHEAVAEKLIEQLREGTAPWQKAWNPGTAGEHMPINPTTGKRYKGINALQLMSEGREDQRWMTYKQAAAVDAQVRKGEKGTPIQYWKFTEEQTKRDPTGKPVRDAKGEPVMESVELERPRVFFATVFNAEQIDGLPPAEPRKAQVWNAVERAEKLLLASGAAIRNGEHDRAFYHPATDSIHLPDKAQFPTADNYYATALHELGHWTGHETRLGRDLVHPFGSEGYAKEELRAEIASMILGDELGIGHDPQQHAAYVGSWIKALQEDPLEIFRAAADAEKIHAYVLGFEQLRSQDQQVNMAAQDNGPSNQIAEANLPAKDEPESAALAATAATTDVRRRVDSPFLQLVVDNPRDLIGNDTGATSQETAFREELGRLSQLSWIQPGYCTLAEHTAHREFAAVFVGDRPAILCGSAKDPQASGLASKLAESVFVRDLLSVDGRAGALRTGALSRGDVEWRGDETVVQNKWMGQVEAIVLRDPSAALAAMLCLTTEAARIINHEAPELDNGIHLAALAADDDLEPNWRKVTRGLHYLAKHKDQAEQWTLERLSRGTLDRDVASAGYDQLVGVWSALNSMQPIDLRNDFWRRNQLPTNAGVHAEAVETATELVCEKFADAEVARARLEHTLFPDVERKNQRFYFDVMKQRFGFHLPPDWDGRVSVTKDDAKDSASTSWSVVAHRSNGKTHWVKAFTERDEADALVVRLEAIAAHSHPNEDERRLLQAKVSEKSIERDPRSTAAEIEAARNAREDAEEWAADLRVAGARQDVMRGYRRSRIGDADCFDALAKAALGFCPPDDWNGQITVQPEAEGIGVYAHQVDGGKFWLTDVATRQAADKLAERLALIDAHSELDERLKVEKLAALSNIPQRAEAALESRDTSMLPADPAEHESAAQMARVFEEQVRRDPESTEEDITAAKEARKDAEFRVAANDPDLQRRIAEQDLALRHATEAAKSTAAVSMDEGKSFIQVPYKQKDEAKALGAKWDRQEQSWYIPPGVDPAPFAKWVQGSTKRTAGAALAPSAEPDKADTSKRMEGRVYLAVPYRERAEAKAAGAEWDKAAKSWYAGPEADMAKLEQWKPENVPAQQGPAMTPREEFADALKSIGCVVGGEHPIMDGQKHRITVEGEKFSENSGSGFYVGHMDGHPAGYMKNNKTGVELTWKAKGYTLDPEQKALMAADAAAKLQQRDTKLARLQDQAATRVADQMRELVPVEQATPYMLAKGIVPHAGAFTDKDGQKTYLPATDAEGKQWTMQYIQENGTKRFAKDSKKEGCFHVVGGTDQLEKAPAIVIAEGYATAGSLAQCLGFATVSAFDSGNLPLVAQALHQKYPDKPVVIAGDDDRHLELTQGVNPGRSKAEEAARLVGGKLLLPIFAPGENSYPADLDPITPKKYREHQKTGSTLSDEQLAALGWMKQYTDFNDLATKSALGQEGIDRQVRSLVDVVIEKHSLALAEQRTPEQGPSHAQETVQAEKPGHRRAAKVA